MNKVFNNVYYVGVDDLKIDLFEGQYRVPKGISYNSYVILDKKIAVIDTVDKNFADEWLNNLKELLGDRNPDYLIIQHMEPDHSANIVNFLRVYPNTIVVGNVKTFKMMNQFFDYHFRNTLIVADMNKLSLGSSELVFIFAPMVHWPEVMVTYDINNKILFSADGFGKFGVYNDTTDWADEARRYYIGIVGKYGMQVQQLLKKAEGLDIKMICPLHGPILKEGLNYYLDLYNTWSSYEEESSGIAIFYTSIYGNTKEVVMKLHDSLISKGCLDIYICDLARTDMSEAISMAFKYGKIVLATTTYNSSIFPFMNYFIEGLIERNVQNKIIGIIENGSWAPNAAKEIKNKLKECKNLTFLEPVISILSKGTNDNIKQIEQLVSKLIDNFNDKEIKNDLSVLFNIGYGLYVVTCKDDQKDNGAIINTVMQLTNAPLQIGVAINKDNYTHYIVKKTGKMNVNCLSVDAPFAVIEKFGFVSGREVDKFTNSKSLLRSNNGIVFLSKYINSFLSLNVVDYIDLNTHGLFVCSVSESRIINNKESMTYNYYQNNIKPKPVDNVKGYVCKVCGYVYEGEVLPEGFICPLCKHGVDDFEKIK